MSSAGFSRKSEDSFNNLDGPEKLIKKPGLYSGYFLSKHDNLVIDKVPDR